MPEHQSVKITIDLPDVDIQEICLFTKEKNKSQAIHKLVAHALMMQRREAIAQKFISGEWSAELSTFEAAQAKDRLRDGAV